MIARNTAPITTNAAAADGDVAPDLRPQLLDAAAPEQALRTSTVLSGGEQADGPRAPDAAEAVDGDGADRIVDAEVLDEVDADHDDRRRRSSPMITAPVAFTQ